MSNFLQSPCSPSGSSVYGILQERIQDCHSLLQRIFLTQGSNPGLLHCRQILHHLSYREVTFYYCSSPSLRSICFNTHSGCLKSQRVLFFAICTTSVQFSSVDQSCSTLYNPMDWSTPGLPVHHQLPKFTQTHVHWVGDAIQPSHPLWSPSSPTPQFKSINSSGLCFLHNPTLTPIHDHWKSHSFD